MLSVLVRLSQIHPHFFDVSYIGRKRQRRAPAQPKAKRGSKRSTKVAVEISSGDEQGPPAPADRSSDSAPAGAAAAGPVVFWRRLVESPSAGWVGSGLYNTYITDSQRFEIQTSSCESGINM